MTVGELREFLDEFGDSHPIVVMNGQGDQVELVAGEFSEDDEHGECAYLFGSAPPDPKYPVVIHTPWWIPM